MYTTLTHLLDLALARVEARPPAAAACVWPSVAVPCAAAAEALDKVAEEQAKLDMAAAVYASVLPVMGTRAGRVTDMLLTSLTAHELRDALHAPHVMHAQVQRMASLLP